MSQNTPPKDEENRDASRPTDDGAKPAAPAAAPAAGSAAPAAQPEPGRGASDGGKDKKVAAPEKVEKPSRRIAIGIGVLSVLAVLLVLFAWRLPPFTTDYERTENAYVRGLVTTLSPQVAGYVTEVLVHDFQTVQAGQPLFRIDDRIYRQRVDQARADVAARQAERANSTQTGASRRATQASREAELGSARAELARAQADAKRVGELAAQGSVSQREREQTEAGLRAARAAVQQAQAAVEVARQDVRSVGVSREGLDAAVQAAEAALRLAEIDLANTTVTAPEAGTLGQIGTRRGQYVSAGTQLASLVPPRLWIIANYKERQAGAMREGQAAVVTVDALDDQSFTGRVRELSPATGSEFAVLPAQNATGNFTKIAQRLPVRIELDPNQPGLERLRPGLSVVARVHVRGEAEEARQREQDQRNPQGQGARANEGAPAATTPEPAR
ncbi:MAG: HlyD family secretion protein [Comamonas sp.]